MSLNFSYGKPGFLNVDLIIYAIYGSSCLGCAKSKNRQGNLDGKGGLSGHNHICGIRFVCTCTGTYGSNAHYHKAFWDLIPSLDKF